MKFLQDINKYIIDSVGIESLSLVSSKDERFHYLRTTSKNKCYKIYKHIYNKPKVYLARKQELIKQFLREYSPLQE